MHPTDFTLRGALDALAEGIVSSDSFSPPGPSDRATGSTPTMLRLPGVGCRSSGRFPLRRVG